MIRSYDRSRLMSFLLLSLTLSGCAKEHTARYFDQSVPALPFSPTSILVNPTPIDALVLPDPTPHVHSTDELILSESKSLYDVFEVRTIRLSQPASDPASLPLARLQKSLGRLTCFKTFPDVNDSEIVSEKSEHECHFMLNGNAELQKLDSVIYISLKVEEIEIPGLKDTRRFQKRMGDFYCMKSIELKTGALEIECRVAEPDPSPLEG